MDCSSPRLLCPWNSPGKSTGVGRHFLLWVSSWPRDWTQIPCIASRFFTVWATGETHLWEEGAKKEESRETFWIIYFRYWFLCICWSSPPNSSLLFQLFWNPLCLNSQSLFLCSCISSFNFAWNSQHMLFSYSVCLTLFSVWSSKFHPCGDQWNNFIISVAGFQGWVMVHCICVPPLL